MKGDDIPARVSRYIIPIMIMMALVSGCGAVPSARARRLVAAMDLDAKAAQLLLVGVPGRGAVPEAAALAIRELGPGGVLLFGFNVPDSARDLAPALAALQDAAGSSAAHLPLLVAIDHEGGKVFRFKEGVTRPPSPLETGRRGPTFARLLGQRVGLELRALGVNLVLGPVVEVLDDSDAAFLGERSFGSDAARVDAVAGAYIEGLTAGGAIAAAKHYPGNGRADPHLSLPVLDLGVAVFRNTLLPRFTSATRHRVPVVMLSHALLPAIDPERPATVSPRLIGFLEGEGGFHGVILTDDLYMKALGAPPAESALKAVSAGADLLMLSALEAARPVRDALVKAVREGRLSPARLDEAAARVVDLKLRYGLDSSLDPGARSAALARLPKIVAQSAALLAAFKP